MAPEENSLLQIVRNSLVSIETHKKFAATCDVSKDMFELYDRFIAYSTLLKNIVENSELPKNHIDLFLTDLTNLAMSYQYIEAFGKIGVLPTKAKFKETVERNIGGIKNWLQQSEFNLNFFRNLGFLKNNIVAIGANGSGKTSLSNKLKSYIKNNSIVISAQRILQIPTFEHIPTFLKTSQDLQESQNRDKSTKEAGQFIYLKNEFEVLLYNLLAENTHIGNRYRSETKKHAKESKTFATPPLTKLDRTIEIWNSLNEHCKINDIDDFRVIITPTKGSPYPMVHLSDGEKGMFFLIAQVLQAPESSFIIVDEPETFLHKTIVIKLWNILEQERPDCIFMYLTHEVDFASSRINAKKVWIRSFTHPDKWDIQQIPENDIPEPLLLELLGSRKNILFCEGRKGSIDEQIYNILFPGFTITPVESCRSVINFTQAFNKIKNTLSRAYGIIDTDHHPSDRIDQFKTKNVYSFEMAEAENLFFDNDFLFLFSESLDSISDKSKAIEQIRSAIIMEFRKLLEIQISNYVTFKINHFFRKSHVSKGNSLSEVNKNFAEFKETIDINAWYDERKAQLEKLIQTKNYVKIISKFNHKHMSIFANQYFNITEFTNQAIRLLEMNPKAKEILLRHFPEQLTFHQNTD